ncbi:MAG: hypothetical protein SCH70_13855 [Candidatus Methanoperedens sp.]|nr:hypothetical protein [Candidatus Methanoperedens sp.]
MMNAKHSSIFYKTANSKRTHTNPAVGIRAPAPSFADEGAVFGERGRRRVGVRGAVV